MNELFPAFSIIASGLQAQRTRMDITSSNLANAQTTRGPNGGPYQKLRPVMAAQTMQFENEVSQADANLQTVEVTGIQRDTTPPRLVFDPTHPDADAKGFVAYPNINLMEEMADMLLASRSYEANVTAFNMSKSMAVSALDIGKV